MITEYKQESNGSRARLGRNLLCKEIHMIRDIYLVTDPNFTLFYVAWPPDKGFRC